MVNFVANTFVTLIQFILRFFKRAVCCLKRRRRLSCEPLPLTNIGVVPNVVEKEVDQQTWGSWEDPPIIVTTGKPIDPVQQKIELYRQQRMTAASDANNEEPKVDYFQDMTPKIVKQKKMLLQPQESKQLDHQVNFSLAPDPVFNSSELGVWEESQSWEDQTEQDWDANDMIREKKRLDRERRLAEQQRKRLEREARVGKSLSATKLS